MLRKIKKALESAVDWNALTTHEVHTSTTSNNLYFEEESIER